MDGARTHRGDWRVALKDVLSRSLVWWVVVLPVLLVCWHAGGGGALGTLTLGLYVGAAALLVLAEYALTFEAAWGSTLTGRLTDFVYAAAASAVEKGTLLLCAAAAAWTGRALSVELGVGLWPSGWPLLAQVVLGLAIADVGAYWRHRLFHRFDALWRFHRIHHSATGLYWIRSAYTHPLEQFAIMLAIMFPISLLGAGDTVIVVVLFAFGLSGLLQHANVDARSSFLNRVFATPEVHRFHHGANATGNASNFSAFFVFMDMLFGSYRQPERHPAPRVVGLEGVTRFPARFLEHLKLPFLPGDPGIEFATAGPGDAADPSEGARPVVAPPPGALDPLRADAR